MSSIPGELRWLPVGLLVGALTAVVASAIFAVGDHFLSQNCTATLLTSAVDNLVVWTVAAGGAGAGWWAARGVTARYGCLAGLVTGLVMAAFAMTVLLVGPVHQESCGGPEPSRVEIVQGAISTAVEVFLLTGLAGLVAARFRLGRERRRRGDRASTRSTQR